MAEKGTLYFFTGLAGAGKTTLGGLFYEHLRELHPDAVLIDGHIERENAVAAGAVRDYSLAARLSGAREMFQRCRDLTEQGHDVVCCSMSLFDEIRDWNRANIENYREIYINTGMEALRKRRVRLYSGEEKQVVGLDLPYEEPKNPDVVVKNDGHETPEEIVARIEREFGLSAEA
jgi:adenylylsulfate kinase